MVRNYSWAPEEFEEVLLKEETEQGWAVILYNDDVNTFDWVIECLMKYCGHEQIQAEQCAWIVHTKGKCLVKTGYLAELEPVCEALLDCGLSAKLEQ